MVVNFDLRRHGDLWPAIESANAVGPAGQAYVDYRIAIRNTGRDAVAGTLVNALPVNVTLVRATTTHGACAVEPGRLVCSLGLLGTGYDSGALVFLRVAYDCEAIDAIGVDSVLVGSPSGDVDPANNAAFVDELDPTCPDPPEEPFFDDPPPDPDPFKDPPPGEPPVAGDPAP